MLIAILLIIAIIVLIVHLASKKKPAPSLPPKIEIPSAPVGIHCDKCGSSDYRFLWDKQTIADDKHLEARPSGYTERESSYSGSSYGTSRGRSHGWSADGIFGFGGNPRAHYGGSRSVHSSEHGGSSTSYSESYRYKEVHVKTFRISCRCKQCGAVWKEEVSEDTYPEIKKIPTMN